MQFSPSNFQILKVRTGYQHTCYTASIGKVKFDPLLIISLQAHSCELDLTVEISNETTFFFYSVDPESQIASVESDQLRYR